MENIDADVRVLRVKVTPNLGGCIHTKTLRAIHSLVGSNAHLVWASLWLWVEIPALLLYLKTIENNMLFWKNCFHQKIKTNFFSMYFQLIAVIPLDLKRESPDD